MSLQKLQSLNDLKAKADRLQSAMRLREMGMEASLARAAGEPPAVPAAPVDAAKASKLQSLSVESAEAAPQSQKMQVPRRKARKTASDVGSGAAPAIEVKSEVSRASRASSNKDKESQGQPLKLEKADREVIMETLKHDIPMQQVALNLGSVAECLPQLSVKRAMFGAKLGNQTFAAAWKQYPRSACPYPVYHTQ